MKRVRDVVSTIYAQQIEAAFWNGYEMRKSEEDYLNEAAPYAIRSNFKITLKDIKGYKPRRVLSHASAKTPDPAGDFVHVLLGVLIGIFMVLVALAFAAPAHAQAASPVLDPDSGMDANFVLTFDAPTDTVYSFDCNGDSISIYTDSPISISYTDDECTQPQNKYTFLSTATSNLADADCSLDYDTCISYLEDLDYPYDLAYYTVGLELPDSPTYLDWLVMNMWIVFLLSLMTFRMFFPPLDSKLVSKNV